MRAIRKLSIVFTIAIILMAAPFLYLSYKDHLTWFAAFAILLIVSWVIRFFISRKYGYFQSDSYGDYWYPIGYVFGGLFLLIALISSFGIISDLEQGAPNFIWFVIGLVVIIIIGVLMIYYSYKAQKEYAYIKSEIQQHKETIKEAPEDAKARKLWLYQIIGFLIFVSIIDYVFRVRRFTLINVVATIVVIVIFALYFKAVTSKPKEQPMPKKKRGLLTIVLLILIFLLFLVPLLVIFIVNSQDTTQRCVSHGLFPVNGIPGLQYCERDSDCIKVTDRFSCCDSCSGGQSNAINKKHLDYWNCLRSENTNCSRVACNINSNITNPYSCSAEAKCVNNICRLD